MSTIGYNNIKNQNDNLNNYLSLDTSGNLTCSIPFVATTISCDTLNAETENIEHKVDYDIEGYVHATGDVVANYGTDDYSLISTAEGLATAEGNITTNTTNISTNTTNISTNTTNISTLQDKTQNIVVYDNTKTTFDKRLNLRDDETQIKLVLDANGITDGDTVLATTALQGIESGFIRTNTISSVSGGDIAINNDLSSLGISNNLRVDGDIEAVQDITSSGIVRAKLFRGWTVPLSGENTFEIGTEGGPLQMYVDENGVLKIATSVVFEPSDAQILANGNASFNNVNFTNLNSNISATEVGYLDGVTSAIQTQLDNKQPLNTKLTTISNETATTGNYLRGDATNFVSSAILAGDLPTAIDAVKIADGSVTNAEFQYLGNVTSDIQTQLDSKQASNSNLTTITTSTTGDLLYSSATDTLSKLAVGTNGQVLTLSAGLPSWQDGGGGSFDPTITSVQGNDLIVYNSSASQWQNGLIPVKAHIVLSASGNLITGTAPTLVYSNVSISNYDAELSDASDFSNILNTWSGTVASWDTSAYVTDGVTYYLRARANSDWGSRKTQWTTDGFSFVATSFFAVTAVWAWTNASQASTNPVGELNDIDLNNVRSTAVFPPTQASAAWYPNNGGNFSMAQRCAIAAGQGADLGTQAIFGNASYTFDSGDSLATTWVNGGQSNVYLLFDLGENRTVARCTLRTYASNTVGGWTTNYDTYFSNQVVQTWNGSTWDSVYTTPTGLTEGQVVSGTFASRTIRYYRLRANSTGYAMCCQCILSAT